MPSRIPTCRLAVVAALAIAASGQACSSQMSQAGQLDESLRAYHHHLLAGDLDRASAYVSSKAMDAFLKIHGDEKAPVVIEDFQIATVRFLPRKDDKSPLQAIVVVAADVRRHDSITIRPVRYRQTWEQFGERWVLADEVMAKPRGERGASGEDDPPRTAPEAEPSPE